MRFNRILQINLPRKQSAFLWGARKTGKSTYLKTSFPESIYFDFLQTDLYFKLLKQPSLLREMIFAYGENQLRNPIVIDEVQKVPHILDEIHWLIENKDLSFILCGSSARKLKRGQANLLGGRAWRFSMHPLTSVEIGNIELLRVLNQGLIPDHYLQEPEQAKMSLKAYVDDYLKEEIIAEALVRNIPSFTRFMDALPYSMGELTNYSDIARDCAVDAKTVREYFQILVDTLIAYRIDPFKKRQSRQVITKSPKYYLFDVGVASYMCKRWVHEEKGEQFGKAFEHFIFMEIIAYRSYKNYDFNIHFWRTKTGIEVDFILDNGDNGSVAIEVKGKHNIDQRDLQNLRIFNEEFEPKKSILVCNEGIKRVSGKIEILPWRQFLDDLWNDRIVG